MGGRDFAFSPIVEFVNVGKYQADANYFPSVVLGDRIAQRVDSFLVPGILSDCFCQHHCRGEI